MQQKSETAGAAPRGWSLEPSRRAGKTGHDDQSQIPPVRLRGRPARFQGKPRPEPRGNAPDRAAAPGPRASLDRPAGCRAAGTPSRLSYDGSPHGPVLRLAGATGSTSRSATLSMGRRRCSGTACVPPLRRGAPGAPCTRRYRFAQLPAARHRLVLVPSGRPARRPDQTAQGLRGVLLVTEDVPPEADLDLLLSVTDRCGRTLERQRQAEPVSADAPPRGRVRLRVLNASTGRDHAGDRGRAPDDHRHRRAALGPFRACRNTMPLGPGARCEMLFDMPPEAAAP